MMFHMVCPDTGDQKDIPEYAFHGESSSDGQLKETIGSHVYYVMKVY